MKTYSLEQGIMNPRDKTLNWQTYDVYETLEQAKREAKKSPRCFWRVIESTVVWEHRDTMGIKVV
jgi:hypothetical protein